MDFINKLVLDHVMQQPAVSVALLVLVAHIDHAISYLLKFFSKDQIEKAIDSVDAMAKSEVDKVSARDSQNK